MTASKQRQCWMERKELAVRAFEEHRQCNCRPPAPGFDKFQGVTVQAKSGREQFWCEGQLQKECDNVYDKVPAFHGDSMEIVA